MAQTAAKQSARRSISAPASSVSVKRFDGRSSKQPPAIAFLMQQHREVEDLFEKFEATEEADQKAVLADEVCLALAVHAKIEEELLYPQARDQVEEEDLVDEASVEHATAKSLIAQIETMQPSDDLYDAKVKVLSEYISHHVKEEESELFPQLKRSDMDLVALGSALEKRAAEVRNTLSSGKDPRKAVAEDARSGAQV